jgi:hypothetical protein
MQDVYNKRLRHVPTLQIVYLGLKDYLNKAIKRKRGVFFLSTAPPNSLLPDGEPTLTQIEI